MKKIIGISIMMLLLALIPSTSIATETQGKEFLLLKGTVKLNAIENNTIHAYAFRLRYLEIKETERIMGYVTFQNVTYPDDFLMISLLGPISLVIGVGDIGFTIE